MQLAQTGSVLLQAAEVGKQQVMQERFAAVDLHVNSANAQKKRLAKLLTRASLCCGHLRADRLSRNHESL
jgi:hypothetical protein